MPNNKDHQKSGSKGSPIKDPDREFEGQGKNKGFGEGKGQQAGSSRQGTGSQGSMEEDEMNTAGGRQGQFSDKDRGSDSEWSPGSTQSSDQ